MESDTSGAFRLSGGAGTGKTVVAIHRARRLARVQPESTNHLDHVQHGARRWTQGRSIALDPDIAIADKPGEGGVYVGGIDSLAKAVLDDSRAYFNAAFSESLDAAVATSGHNERLRTLYGATLPTP